MKFEELLNLLKSAQSPTEINDKREEIAELIPKIRIMFDFDQKNRAHQYDLWMHCVHTVANLPKNIQDDMLYLAALLYDIGKPDCQACGKRADDTNMHYYGHPKRSMEIVRDEVIPALSEKGVVLSANCQRRLLYYVEYHDDRVSLRIGHLKRHLQLASLEEFQHLMMLEAADAKAHVQIPIVAERLKICETLSGAYAEELYQTLSSTPQSSSGRD